MNSKVILLLVSLLITAASSIAQSTEKRISYQEYIEDYKDIAIKKMHEYGIPASITLAQGLLESGSGNSALCKDANNHFGIKCHKEWTGMTYIMDDDEKGECFRKYNSPDESFNDHSLFLTTRPRYAGLFTLDVKDYKGWAYGLKSAGYATNPRYAEMLIKIIEENQLYLYDSGAAPNALLADKDNVNPTDVTSSVPLKDYSKRHYKFVEVTFGNRNIYENNGSRFTYAREGDDARKIADDVGIHTFQILQYNELGKDEKIAAGSIVYVEPKKKKSKEKSHIVVQGETMRDISQLYAIKLKSLYKLNKMPAGHEPAVGDEISLRK
jgi:hypothetical protein